MGSSASNAVDVARGGIFGPQPCYLQEVHVARGRRPARHTSCNRSDYAWGSVLRSHRSIFSTVDARESGEASSSLMASKRSLGKPPRYRLVGIDAPTDVMITDMPGRRRSRPA